MASDKPESRSPKHRRVSSKLKQLAEVRARAAGEIEIHLIGHRDVVRIYERQKQMLSLAEQNFKISEKFRIQLVDKLAAIDADILKVAPGFKPDAIEPIRASKGRYLEYGTLGNYLHSVLTKRAPEYVSTSELATLATETFSLKFSNAERRNTWSSSSLVGALQRLEVAGLVERGPKQKNPKAGPTNIWRLKIELPMCLSDLDS